MDKNTRRNLFLVLGLMLIVNLTLIVRCRNAESAKTADKTAPDSIAAPAEK